MDPQQLIDFVRRQLVQGKTREEIEWTLRLNRASDKEIAIAFNAAEWQKDQNLPIPAARRGGGRRAIWLPALLLLILAITTGATFLVLFKPDFASRILGLVPSAGTLPVTPSTPLPEEVSVPADTTDEIPTTTISLAASDWTSLSLGQAEIRYPGEWLVFNPLPNHPEAISPMRYLATPGLTTKILENFDSRKNAVPAGQAIIQFFGKSSGREDLATIRTKLENAGTRDDYAGKPEVKTVTLNGFPAIRATFSDKESGNRHIYYVLELSHPLGKMLYGLDFTSGDDQLSSLTETFETIVKTFTLAKIACAADRACIAEALESCTPAQALVDLSVPFRIPIPFVMLNWKSTVEVTVNGYGPDQLCHTTLVQRESNMFMPDEFFATNNIAATEREAMTSRMQTQNTAAISLLATLVGQKAECALTQKGAGLLSRFLRDFHKLTYEDTLSLNLGGNDPNTQSSSIVKIDGQPVEINFWSQCRGPLATNYAETPAKVLPLLNLR